MNRFFENLIHAFGSMPLSKKITMLVVVLMVVGGFSAMFFWANQVDYQLLYSELSQEDAGKITGKLREQRIAFQLSGGGTSILVPADKVYELRLSLANDGIPSGGHVGFEIFDKTDFSTTEFVQKLNYQRALQGELVRTINEFKEVENSRVLLVLPKDSLFVQDVKPPSASVMLKLKAQLSPDKVAGIVHLVASAVEGLSPDQVTVVDSSGRVLSKGPDQGDEAALFSSNKLDYQRRIEEQISSRVQSMLEGIVGKGGAIVRVSADLDFEQVDLSEEKFDPDGSVIRSQQRRTESKNDQPEYAGEEPGEQGGDTGTSASKSDEVTNYEINRVTKHIVSPSGKIRRLSVAAVVGGTYEAAAGGKDPKAKKYVPRAEDELKRFESVVKTAMGYSADRGDEVYVSSFPLSASNLDDLPAEAPGFDWASLLRSHIKTILNIMLVFLVFFFVVRPLLKSTRDIGSNMRATGQQAITAAAAVPALTDQQEALAAPPPMDEGLREKTSRVARENPERAEQMIREWLHGGGN